MDMITLAMAEYCADRFVKTTQEVLIPETTAEFERVYDGIGVYSIERPLDIATGDTLKVDWDGKQYDCTVHSDGEDTVWFGNSAIAGGEENTGEPFCYACRKEYATFYELNAGTHTFSVIKYTETIDPKYLPKSVVDFDELGITSAILELFNKGGGTASVVDGDVSAAKVIAEAFPLDGNYVAKATIPDIGTMYIKPVLTTFGEGRFKTTHLDSYLYDGNTGELTKFYARVGYGSNIAGGEDNTIRVIVGFYT